MADKEKKPWYERAWDWRTKNIRDPIRETKIGGDIGEIYDRTLGKYMPGPEGRASTRDWVKNIPQKSNIKDSLKIFGNYIDWERRMLGAVPHTLPRSFGFDYEFYNPFSPKEQLERKKEGLWDFSTIIPGIDFKGYDQSVMGVGGIDDLWSTTLFNQNLNLSKEDSAARKFLKQYDSPEAFQAYINDHMTDENRANIKKRTDEVYDYGRWAIDHKYNPKSDFDKLYNRRKEYETQMEFLDPYMKSVGAKYKDRMISEFGAYDTGNMAYLYNLGLPSGKPVEMTNEDKSEYYFVDNEWLNAGEDGPYFPEEFNFGALDPIADELFADFPFEYDEKEHYEHLVPNIGVGILTGGGVLSALRNTAMRLPKHMQTALKVAHPSTSQLGFGSKNARWFARDYPTIRGGIQTVLAPVVSEKFKQRDWYPDER